MWASSGSDSVVCLTYRHRYRELIVSPRAFSAAALAATAALSLLLTACGGDEDGDPPSDDKIQGADKGEESPSPSASEEAAGRPEIKLPGDVRVIADWSQTGDPDEDAILRDTEQRIAAIEMALAEQDPTHEAFRFYSEGEAAAETEAYVTAYVHEEARITGTIRLYEPTVTIRDDGTATLAYCEDQSKAFDKYLKTGELNKTPVTKNSYFSHGATLRKDGQGTWITMKDIATQGASPCQP
ncbi:hypothetical protein OG946_11930 [Streptomyces sp. NBC_01808]|uniref:hypothetical protein n=1 Tax=Streptomyces sp. NBC_01808 TaxID=2975947 RepID=UPI002DDAA1F3|nr:hypothetical protein [Streptomyces sp. NBC_01808]WSA38026.1 hypothetical protein OG946_11930 [Streptomyces sp. NBC_01808]